MNNTYTQVVDEKTGEIKFIPTNPPEQQPDETSEGQETGAPDFGGTNATIKATENDKENVVRNFNDVDFTPDPKVTDQLRNLLANSNRLRFNRRLEAGKLDGRRLSSYRTSTRLFKKKAIKDRNYQFTFLMDTSGSMLGREWDDVNEQEGRSKIELSSEAVARTVKSLQDINIRSAVFSMNNAFELLKDFDTKLDDDEAFYNSLVECIASDYINEDGEKINKCGGTHEKVAYDETVEYLKTHSKHGVTNVVIVLSDGAPGGSGPWALVNVGDGERQVKRESGRDDSTDNLARFWERQQDVLTFGIGIQSKASQVPNNRMIDDINSLPEVLGSLLTELML